MLSQEDLGINRTGGHCRTLTNLEMRVIDALLDRTADNPMPADELAVRVFFCTADASDDLVALTISDMRDKDRAALEDAKRDVRDIQNHLLLLHERLPIYSRAGKNGGYFFGTGDEDGEIFYGAFRRRAITGFRKATRGKAATAIQMMEQLSLEFEPLQDIGGLLPAEITAEGRGLHLAVVDKFLDRMLAEPERFGPDLARIQQKFGSVLMPKDQALAIKRQAAELASMLEAIR